jgi:hypothetical protein
MNNDNETITLPWEDKKEDDGSSASAPLTQDELEEVLFEIRY